MHVATKEKREGGERGERERGREGERERGRERQRVDYKTYPNCLD